MAAGAVGLAHQTAYRLRRREATFAAGWDAALVLARDGAEQVLAERAIHGVEEIVFYRGEEVGRRRRFDARLLLAHLARLDARADDPATLRHAERFDELLGAIGAGLTLEPVVDERTRALDSGAEETPGLVFPQPDRMIFVADELFREQVDAYPLDENEDDEDEPAGEAEDGEDGEDAGDGEAGEDWVCDPVWQGACDRARRAAPWDAEFAATCAVVDALIAGVGGEDEEQEPPREYKSLGLVSEGAEFAALDRGTFGTFGQRGRGSHDRGGLLTTHVRGHPEPGSGSIGPIALRRPDRPKTARPFPQVRSSGCAGRWTLKRVQGDESGDVGWQTETVTPPQVHTASGGRLIRIASMLPPVFRPNSVPRS